jgi:hypothetical protein
LKDSKIIITLTKQIQDSIWLDLRMKSTQNAYQELERFEKINDSSPKENNANYDTPFKENSCCSHHHSHEKHK